MFRHDREWPETLPAGALSPPSVECSAVPGQGVAVHGLLDCCNQVPASARMIPKVAGGKKRDNMESSHEYSRRTVLLACVYSLPRSGSTMLLAELDRWEGIVCVPESYFPQMLELMTPRELGDPRRMAALFLASSDSGAVLTFDEAVQCMMPHDPEGTITQLGLACAAKTGRDLSKLRAIVWKTTRLVGRWKLFARAGGRFLVLRRNPVNVFDSQFRVDFGRRNRRPLRFAAFRESYEAVFCRLPRDLALCIDYESIPEQLATVLSFLGIEQREWGVGESLLAQTSAKHRRHDHVMDGFKSRDVQQKRNVTTRQRALLRTGQILCRPLRPLFGLIRDHYDRQMMDVLRARAAELMDVHSG